MWWTTKSLIKKSWLKIAKQTQENEKKKKNETKQTLLRGDTRSKIYDKNKQEYWGHTNDENNLFCF